MSPRAGLRGDFKGLMPRSNQSTVGPALRLSIQSNTSLQWMSDDRGQINLFLNAQPLHYRPCIVLRRLYRILFP
jgi:hypothetical protein